MSAVAVGPGGAVSYRASALGSCMAALVAGRLGVEEDPVPPSLQAAFDAGHAAEPKALAALAERGWKVVGRQREVVVDLGGGVKVVGHVDGIAYPPAQIDVVVVDVKSQGPAAWEQAQRAAADLWDLPLFAKYLWQFSAYSAATGMPAWLVRYNRQTGQTVATEVPSERLFSVEQIAQRVRDVERLALDGAPPPCTLPSWGCPYASLHEEPPPPPVVPELTSLAQEYLEADRAVKEATDARDDARRALLDAMADGGWDKAVTSTGVRVARSVYATRTLDKQAAASEGIDLGRWYVERPAERLTVREGDG